MSTVQIIRNVLGAYQTNVYLVFDQSSKKGFIVDPGYVCKELCDYIVKNKIEPEYIILTHGHGDHTGGIDFVKNIFPDIKLIASDKEKEFLISKKNSMGRGDIKADIYVKDEETLEAAATTLKFLSTPGHTPGGMCILMNEVLFAGDTLFKGSVGRTDFIGGNEELLIKSIKTKLLTLNEDIKVLPGHGEPTTIAYEKRFNPFVQD